jgi:predicted secreted protein
MCLEPLIAGPAPGDCQTRRGTAFSPDEAWFIFGHFGVTDGRAEWAGR